jgi:sporulation protein YlmC with PRC-barrel domain
MLQKVRDLEHWTITSRDGHEVGAIEDSYFDDGAWTVRYLIVNAGNWLTGRPVLISPFAVSRMSLGDARVHLGLTRTEIEHAPSPETRTPVSRRFEADFSRYYGYPPYWSGTAVWGAYPVPVLDTERVTDANRPTNRDVADLESVHLRSAKEVSGYHIQALDGEIGHVEDFIVDSSTWTIRYLVIDTSNWIGGRTVVLSPDWVRRVDWSTQKIHVDSTRDMVKHSPPYDPTADISSDYEKALRAHYSRTSHSK